MTNSGVERFRSQGSRGSGTQVTGAVLVAILYNLLVFTGWGISAYIWLAFAAVLTFGYWFGYHHSGESTSYYVKYSVIFGALTYIIFVIVASILYPSGISTGSFTRTFVRVGLGAVFLCAAGTLTGDMVVRKKVKFDRALIVILSGALGAIANFLQLFVK